MDCDLFCLWIGRLFIVYVIFISVRLFHYLWKLYIFPTPVDFFKYGKWSVVTGATSGIGKSMAFELASRGQNIILISRSKEKLEKVADEIASKHQVKTKWLQIDFSDDEHIYDEIKNFLEDYDVGVLVNNVGISQPIAEFLTIPNLSKTIRNIVRVNITSTFKMHEIALPGMVKKGKGIIFNLSSASRLKPINCLSMYGASKTLIDYFSRTLSYEYEDKGIIIQSLCPFGLQSQMTKVTPTYDQLPTPDSWVKSVLNSVGRERTVHGDMSHFLKGFFLNNVPFVFSNLQKRIKGMKNIPAKND